MQLQTGGCWSQVRVVLLGLDITMIVEGQELVSMKLQGVGLQVDVGAGSPSSIAHETTLNVDDLIIKDLQVSHCCLSVR